MTEPEDGLWRFDQLEAVTAQPPPRNEFTQIVIGVDPAIGGGDETGIIVAGRHKDGQIWVLVDATTTLATSVIGCDLQTGRKIPR